VTFSSCENPIKSLVHDWGTTNPHSLDVIDSKFTDLSSDEILIPPLRVKTLLRQTKMELEVHFSIAAAEVCESFEKFDSNGIRPPGE